MGSLAVCFVFRGDTVMKLGFDLGKLMKMKKMRKIFTPVLIIALVLCGFWLPDVKVKAWSVGDPATLKIVFNLDGGEDNGYYSSESIKAIATFTSTGYSTASNFGGSFYNFGNQNETVNFFNIPEVAYVIPAKNGVLATKFTLADRSIEDDVEITQTIGDIIIGQSYDISDFSGLDASRFDENGVFEVVFKAVYDGDTVVLNYHFGDNDTSTKTSNAMYAEKWGANQYYFKIENVPDNLGYSDNGNLTYTHSFNDGIGNGYIYALDRSDIRTMGEGGSYIYSPYSSDSSAISFNRTFYPDYVFYLPVTFEAGEHGSISGTTQSSVNENFETEIGGDGNYGYHFRLTSFPAITADPGYTFTGKWEMENPPEYIWYTAINGSYDNFLNPATTKIDASTGVRVHVGEEAVAGTNSVSNIRAVFKPVYKQDLTLTVNFAVPQNYGGTFPAGSKYLSPLTLTIPEPDQLPVYYEFTIPGEDIDEVSIVYEETGFSAGPYPHYLKAFVDNNDVLESGTANVALGENATILVDSTIFNDNSASITLTGVFSGQAGLNLFRQGSGGGDFAKLIRFEDNYAVCKGQLDPSTIFSGDTLPAGLISFAECFTYAGSEQLLIKDSNGNAVTKMGYGTDYYFYILKSVVDASGNSSVNIPLAPVGKMEFDATFDAGVGGTITGEGTATTKTVTVSAEEMDGNDNWNATVAIPQVTPKSGYVFKQWNQTATNLFPGSITGTSETYSISDSSARSADPEIRLNGISYTAEYYQCSLIATFNPGDHAQSGIQTSSTTINSKSYDAATGKFTFEVTFPSYTPVSDYVHDGFEVMTNNYGVSLAQGSYYPAGQTVEIEASAGNATQIQLTFTAHYDTLPVLTVNFFVGGMQSGTTGVINPVSNTPDSYGYYSYSVTIPNITNYTNGFGAAFPVDSISSSLQGQNDIVVYRGGSRLESDDIADNETVTVAVKQNMTLTWDATYAIKQTGAYELYDGNFCLTRGNWSVAITGGESDGYAYNVTDPVYIYPGSNR